MSPLKKHKAVALSSWLHWDWNPKYCILVQELDLRRIIDSFGWLPCGVFCSLIPDRAIKRLGRKIEQNSLRWGVDLYRLCIQSAGISLPGSAGNIPFLSLLFTPTGFHSPLEDPASWFYSWNPFYEKGMQGPLCPWETDPVGWREGWSWDTEELGREEMLLLYYKSSSLLCRTCCLVIVQFLSSLPFLTLSMHRPNNSKAK